MAKATFVRDTFVNNAVSEYAGRPVRSTVVHEFAGRYGIATVMLKGDHRTAGAVVGLLDRTTRAFKPVTGLMDYEDAWLEMERLLAKDDYQAKRGGLYARLMAVIEGGK